MTKKPIKSLHYILVLPILLYVLYHAFAYDIIVGDNAKANHERGNPIRAAKLAGGWGAINWEDVASTPKENLILLKEGVEGGSGKAKSLLGAHYAYSAINDGLEANIEHFGAGVDLIIDSINAGIPAAPLIFFELVNDVNEASSSSVAYDKYLKPHHLSVLLFANKCWPENYPKSSYPINAVEKMLTKSEASKQLEASRSMFNTACIG
ncbi:hypothetical protein VCHA53O466_50551 [Vibrio chagasii]|nr:hypothetical protein VCHA53O466_50551 [Vibrio chagasii]